MNFRLGEVFENPAAIIREHKRQTNFTIKEIGGPNEIAAWRVEQARKLSAYDTKRDQLKKKQVDLISGDSTLEDLTWKGKVLLADPQAWKNRAKLAKERRKEYHQPQILTHLSVEKEVNPGEIESKPTFFDNIKSFMSKVWHFATSE